MIQFDFVNCTDRYKLILTWNIFSQFQIQSIISDVKTENGWLRSYYQHLLTKQIIYSLSRWINIIIKRSNIRNYKQLTITV